VGCKWCRNDFTGEDEPIHVVHPNGEWSSNVCRWCYAALGAMWADCRNERILKRNKEQPDSAGATTNSDYTTAIRVIKEYCQSRPGSSYVGALLVWCEDRVNPAKRDFV